MPESISRRFVMPEPARPAPDFGILFEELPPPPEKVRCFISPGRVLTKYTGTAILTALGLGLAALFANILPMPAGAIGCAASLATFGAFVYLVARRAYRWVELDGDTIRARHLYTGRTVERSVEEIDCLCGWGTQVG